MLSPLATLALLLLVAATAVLSSPAASYLPHEADSRWRYLFTSLDAPGASRQGDFIEFICESGTARTATTPAAAEG